MCCAMNSYKLSMSFSQHEKLKDSSHSTPAHPATEALNRQSVDNNLHKRRKLGGNNYPRLSLNGLGESLCRSSYISEQRGDENTSFPQIVDIGSLDASWDVDEYDSGEFRYELTNCHLGKRYRGVVRSQAIPSCMWSMDGASLATAT